MTRRIVNPLVNPGASGYQARSEDEAARGVRAAHEVISEQRGSERASYAYVEGLIDGTERLAPRNPAFYGAYQSTLRDYLSGLEGTQA